MLPWRQWDSNQAENGVIPVTESDSATTQPPRRAMGRLTLAALGIVYGDIGTSPLYTVREAFGEAGGLTPDPVTVLGVLSLIFWALTLIVSIKYVCLVMRADNRGEGGILALASLALRNTTPNSAIQRLLYVLAMSGVALFFGDGMITPAISVLSAVEGLNSVTHVFEPYVVPIAATVLIGLFLIQRHGTEVVGRLFGPVMLLWFAVLALLGLAQILLFPGVLRALDPRYAIALFQHEGWRAFIGLGAIVLAVTGVEALYADMGHFGARPIRLAWVSLVMPALALNYFGQGALILTNPEAVDHLFFRMAPDWALLPLVLLATLATVIASQAVISGVFSLARQAVQLGYLPRMAILHTSEMEQGQIYIPRMNWALMVAVLVLVATFKSSGNLAAAYGIAVTAVMSITSVTAGIVARQLWRWKLPYAILVFGGLLTIDLTFLLSNSLKIPNGGWLPLLIGGVLFVVIITWRRGRQLVFDKLHEDALPLALFLDRLDVSITRVPGTAIYMTGDLATVPGAMLHNVKHNHVLHHRIVLMRVSIEEIAHVSEGKRVHVDRLGKGFFSIFVSYGFMDQPDVPRALALCRAFGLSFDMMETSFFLGRETVVERPTDAPADSGDGLPAWQQRLFIALSATASTVTRFFRLPPNRVVELGAQIEI